MVTNYYNSSNNFSSPIRTEPKPHAECSCDATPERFSDCIDDSGDKLLILGLLFCLYMTGCRDKLLLLALLFLWIY